MKKEISGLNNIIRYMIKNNMYRIDDETPKLYLNKSDDYVLRSRKKKDDYGLGIDIIYYSSNVCFEFDVFMDCLEGSIGTEIGKSLIQTIQEEVSRSTQIKIAQALFTDNEDYGAYIVDDDLICFYNIYEM